MIKSIFFDLDRTLLNGDKRISNSAVKSFRYLPIRQVNLTALRK